MAPWQCDLYLAPPDARGGGDAEPVVELPAGHEERLAAILPRMPAWAPELEQWGPEEESCIHVWRLGGGRAVVRVRVDVRRPWSTFVERVHDFAQWAGCRLMMAEGRAPLPPHAKWISELVGSSARRAPRATSSTPSSTCAASGSAARTTREARPAA